MSDNVRIQCHHFHDHLGGFTLDWSADGKFVEVPEQLVNNYKAAEAAYEAAEKALLSAVNNSERYDEP